jgi:hypothetical protein
MISIGSLYICQGRKARSSHEYSTFVIDADSALAAFKEQWNRK